MTLIHHTLVGVIHTLHFLQLQLFLLQVQCDQCQSWQHLNCSDIDEENEAKHWRRKQRIYVLGMCLAAMIQTQLANYYYIV